MPICSGTDDRPPSHGSAQLRKLPADTVEQLYPSPCQASGPTWGLSRRKIFVQGSKRKNNKFQTSGQSLDFPLIGIPTILGFSHMSFSWLVKFHSCRVPLQGITILALCCDVAKNMTISRLCFSYDLGNPAIFRPVSKLTPSNQPCDILVS